MPKKNEGRAREDTVVDIGEGLVKGVRKKAGKRGTNDLPAAKVVASRSE